MAKFNTALDIQNRCLQHLGQPRVASTTEFSKGQTETTFAYDKVRRSEYRRAVWTHSTRRAVMRARANNTVRVTFATWALATAYTAGDIVADSTGFLWLAQIASTGVTPGSETGPNPKWIAYFGPLYCPPHDTGSTFYPGDLVAVSAVVYICVAQNSNQTPPNATYWHVVQGASVVSLIMLAPLGYKPDGSAVRTLFYLPANYLRMAPQEPKIAAGSTSNVTAGMRYNDWEIEAGVLSTAATSSPFILRFVADQTDVTTMDDMFCEAVAARMAMELCETFTQAQDKLAAITNAYERAVTAARLVSAIEAGTTEDDFADLQAGQQQGRGRG